MQEMPGKGVQADSKEVRRDLHEPKLNLQRKRGYINLFYDLNL